MSFDLVSMWHSMGFFAKFIAAILGIMSIYSLGVMAERLVTYARASSASRQYAEQLRGLLPARKYGDAVALAKKLRRGHLSRVLGLAIEEYDRGVNALHRKGPDDVGNFDVVAAVNRAIDRSSMRTVADLRRGLGALATVGSTAPFVGLLGTVAGIITAFQAMAATGSGGLGSVSAGIAEALVTTAFGLLVAIPAVMMFNYLTNRVEDMQVDINDSANELVDYFMKEGRSEPSVNVE
jgi:biopolymer transport protein ExbB/TolQ